MSTQELPTTSNRESLTKAGLTALTAKKQLTETEASALYGLTVHWFRRKRWEGGGPRFRKVGNRCYYDPAELESYFSSLTKSNTSEYPPKEPPLPATGVEV